MVKEMVKTSLSSTSNFWQHTQHKNDWLPPSYSSLCTSRAGPRPLVVLGESPWPWLKIWVMLKSFDNILPSLEIKKNCFGVKAYKHGIGRHESNVSCFSDEIKNCCINCSLIILSNVTTASAVVSWHSQLDKKNMCVPSIFTLFQPRVRPGGTLKASKPGPNFSFNIFIKLSSCISSA